MKLSWGTGIWAFYGLFVVGILTLVGMSVAQKIDLVTDQYYAEELRFQSKIDKINNAKKLTTPLRWEVTDAGVQVFYPAGLKGIEGKINLYCPSDNRKDFSVAITPNAQHQQLIPAAKIATGRYQIQFDWTHNGTTYWNDGTILFAR
jgi:hypothetical protein